MKRGKKALALLLAVSMTLSLLTVGAAAADAEQDTMSTVEQQDSGSKNVPDDPEAGPAGDPADEPVDAPAGEPADDPAGEPVDDPEGNPVEKPTADPDTAPPAERATYVAAIGEKSYETLQAAINAANAMDAPAVIELLGDIDLGADTVTMTILAGKDVAIDFKGFTITGAADYSKGLFVNLGALTLKDSSGQKGGINCTGKTTGYGVINGDKELTDLTGQTGTLILENIKIVSAGTGVYNKAGSTATINGCEFSGKASLLNNGIIPTIADTKMIATSVAIKSQGADTTQTHIGSITNCTIHGESGYALQVMSLIEKVEGSVLTSGDRAVIQLSANAKPEQRCLKETSVTASKGDAILLYGGTISIESGEYQAAPGKLAIAKGGTNPSAVAVEISGGTFSSKVEETYLADGVVQNDNGEVGKLEQVAVAEVITSDGVTTRYATLQAAVDAASDGATVKLLDNIVLDACVTVANKTITLDMNQKTTTNTKDIWDEKGNIKVWSHIRVGKEGNLTITGDGTIQAKKNDCYAIDLNGENAKCTIENGTFIGNISAVYVHTGALTVKGGSFSIQQKQEQYHDERFTLNCRDENYESKTASITVSGGTFEKFDPADCPAEEEHTNFCAAGYASVKDGDWYTVMPLTQAAVAQVGDAYYTTLEAAINAAAENGGTVKLLKTVTDVKTLTLDSGKTIDLNLNGFDLKFATDELFKVTHGVLNLTGQGMVESRHGNTSGTNVPVLYAYGSVKDEENHSVITIGKDVTVQNLNGYGIGIGHTDTKAYGAKVVIAGHVNAKKGFSVTGNATATEGINLPEIVVEQTGSIYGSDGAIYAAGYAKYHVAGSLEGKSFGIEIRAGELTIEDTATITASGAFSNPVPNGNGFTVTGAAIAVSQHNTNLPIKVEIKGGNISETGTNGYALYEIDTVPNEDSGDVAKEVSISVTGGTFSGGVYSTNKKLSISGGKFSSTLDESYLAEGYVQNANGEVGKLDEVAVAEVTTADGTKKYETLQKAVAAAADGGTVTLLKDVTLTSKLTIGKKVILNLNGNKIMSASSTAIYIENGELELTGRGTIDVTGEAFRMKGQINADAFDTKVPSVLTIGKDIAVDSESDCCIFGYGNGVTVNVYGKLTSHGIYATIMGNGTVNDKTNGGGTVVNIYPGAVVEHPTSMAIYHPQNGELNILGGTITGGTTGVEMRAGKLKVENGTIVSTSKTFSCDPNGSGSTTVGAAIAIAQHTTKKDITVTIQGGTFKGVKALNESNPQKNDPAPQVVMSIKGGLFNGDVTIEDKHDAGFISGGYFTSDPSAYVAADHYVVDSDKTGYSCMVTDEKPEEAPVIVTETVEATVSGSLGEDKETVSNLLASNPPAVSGIADALTENGENAILNAAGVTEAEKENADNLIKIEIEVKVEAVQADLSKNELTFKVTPVATVKVDGTVKKSNLPVDNGYLDGKGITVKLPVPENFDVQEIKHTSDSKGVEYFLNTGTNTFTVKDGYAELTIRHFSELKLSGNVTAAAMVDGTAYPTLQKAIDAAGSGDTITVLAGVDKTERVTVSGKSLTIELGKTGYSADNIATGSRTEKVVTGTTVKITYSAPSSGGGSSSSGDYVVSVEDSKHGTVTVSPKRAEKGDTVTITVKPDTGYELDGLTVTDKSGDAVKLKDKGNNKFTFTMPGSKVVVEASFKLIEAEPEAPAFVDVPASAYYADAVAWAVVQGITTGTGANTFSPDLSCTRAQMVTFLWRAHGSPKADGANPFTDVSADAYYYDAVLWAVKQGITSGTTATTFSPDAVLTRGQTVTFLWRANGSPAVSGNSFGDVADEAYYADAVAWAVKEGITSGTGGNSFSPDAPCTRGQIVTFLYRAQ